MAHVSKRRLAKLLPLQEPYTLILGWNPFLSEFVRNNIHGKFRRPRSVVILTESVGCREVEESSSVIFIQEDPATLISQVDKLLMGAQEIIIAYTEAYSPWKLGERLHLLHPEARLVVEARPNRYFRCGKRSTESRGQGHLFLV